MRKSLLFLFLFLSQAAYASPVFEGLQWMTNVGLAVGVVNFLWSFALVKFVLRPQSKAMLKSVGFGLLQFVLTMISIPLSWIGAMWLAYWIKANGFIANALFIIGLIILPAVAGIFVFWRNRKKS